MLHNQVLGGKEVILRPLTEEDVALLARWFSEFWRGVTGAWFVL